MSQKELNELNDALTDMLQHMPRPPGKEDWEYRDLPKIRSDFFAQFIELVGEENIVWITRARYEHEDGTYERGQLWVSPAGLQRARDYAKSKAS